MCKSCGMDYCREFKSELCIHFTNIDQAAVFVFPKIVVCLSCGFTELVIPEAELQRLAGTENPAA